MNLLKNAWALLVAKDWRAWSAIAFVTGLVLALVLF